MINSLNDEILTALESERDELKDEISIIFREHSLLKSYNYTQEKNKNI